MADVQFDESAAGIRRNQMVGQTPYFVNLVFKTGITTDVKIAQYILLGLAIVALLIAAIIFWNISTPPAPPQIPQEILMEMN